jgi:AcrR family transcriptional regulator
MLTDPALTQQSNGAPLRRGERRKQHTKRRLLDAAMEIYAECGVESTTISAITERADVGLGTFYLHFADKDAIAETVCEIVMARLAAEEAQTFEAMTSLNQPADRIEVFVRVMIARVAEAPELLAAMFRWEGPRGSRTAPTPALDTNPLRVALIGHLTASLAHGTYRETDLELMARAIVGMAAQCVPAWVESGRNDWTDLARFLERAATAAFT